MLSNPLGYGLMLVKNLTALIEKIWLWIKYHPFEYCSKCHIETVKESSLAEIDSEQRILTTWKCPKCGNETTDIHIHHYNHGDGSGM